MAQDKHELDDENLDQVNGGMVLFGINIGETASAVKQSSSSLNTVVDSIRENLADPASAMQKTGSGKADMASTMRNMITKVDHPTYKA